MDLKELKEALYKKDLTVASNVIVNLYTENPDTFKKSLLLSNSLPNPVGREFNDDELNLLFLAFNLASKELLEKEIEFGRYMVDYMQIYDAIKIVSQNLKNNQERLKKNTFSNFSLSEQLQMFCIFIEDQFRLFSAQDEMYDKKFLTGMEYTVAKYNVENFEGMKVSGADTIEAFINIADTLFRLLYFEAGESVEKAVNFDHEGITPYELGNFEEIIHLTLQRYTLIGIWDKFKYREWKLAQQEKGGNEYYFFYPSKKDDYKKERIAIDRDNYRDHINIQKKNAKYLKENQKSVNYIDEIASTIDAANIQKIFQLEKKKFFQASIIVKNSLAGQLEPLDNSYYSLEHNGVKIVDLIKGFEYLVTIAMIYQSTVLREFNQEDKTHYKRLSPIIDKDIFINQFSYLYDIGYTIAEKIINTLIFFRKSKLDVFSQPLIYVGKNKVILCPTLILQMNTVRIVEEIVAKQWKINISDKGESFEKDLRFILSFNPYIQVNRNKIEFLAYDGRDVEFDFIGLFEDHLLLIEFKHIKTPYGDKEMKDALNTIDCGIEQVNRREKILKHDWGKIKEKCSFKLPEAPPNKVIKLLCTNIFNFSTIIREGVEIIDSSLLTKFFVSPEINKVIIGGEVKEALHKKLWKKTYPTVEEFKTYLKCPEAIKTFVNSYEEIWRPSVKMSEGDYNIGYLDYNLINDPFENVNIEMFESANPTNNKVGRNEPCPCGSGKKYKKCCGK